MSVSGFAIRMGDTIAIRSVADTERGAKVNFLVAAAGVFVTGEWTDDEIDRAFILNAPQFRAVCVPVIVTEALN